MLKLYSENICFLIESSRLTRQEVPLDFPYNLGTLCVCS